MVTYSVYTMSNVSHPLVWKILAREKVIFLQQVSLQSKVESEILCSDNTVVISGVHLRDKDYFDPHHILVFKGTHPQSARQGTHPQSARQGTHPQSARQGTHPQSARQGTHPQSARQGTHPQSARQGHAPNPEGSM